ncbi:hypothetical protein [Methyloglobulus sp.]|uniref:hypothetical protein n=1 Tax=Methyloglobulus sp. TaxID=2518622 RepID=UPI00398A40F2
MQKGIESNINLKKYKREATAKSANDAFIIFPIKSTTATTANVFPNLSAREKIIRYWQEENQSIFQKKIDAQFFAIRQRKENWDFRDSKKPNKISVSNAEGIIRDLLTVVIEAGRFWLTPFTTSDEDGNITVEWHKGRHELHLEVMEDEVEYIKVWGINIESEMHLEILGKGNYLSLWDWLLNG